MTYPLLCNMEGGFDAVVKYPMNPVGMEVLIDEWIGNSIADAIELTIPQYGIGELSAEVIESSEVFGEIDNRNSGECFFSKMINNTAPLNSKLLQKASNKETERLLLFDHLIKNEDRHNGNIIIQITKEIKVYYIDCSHFMTVGSLLNKRLDIVKEKTASEIQNDHLLTNKGTNKGANQYNMLCNNMGFNESVLIEETNRIKAVLNEKVMDSIMRSIPKCWINENTKSRIEDVFTVLKIRLEHIDDICNMIIQNRRGLS